MTATGSHMPHATTKPYDVTVVVPVLNVEKYLRECLGSLAAQTMFERTRVVLVDNGSADRSVEIAQGFAARYPNVDLISWPRGRAGGARNAGMDLADTRHIAFWDADDVAPADALELLWSELVKTGATVAVGRAKRFPQAASWAWQKSFGAGNRVVTNVADVPDLIHSAACWNKMFDLEFLRSCSIRFAEDVHFEDAFVALPALLFSRRIALVDALVYEYRVRGDGTSITDTQWQHPQNYWDHLLLVEQLAALRPQLSPYHQETLERWLVAAMQGFLLRAPRILDEEALRVYFERSRAVYRGITPEQLARATHNTRHRLPYLALCAGDFELFARPENAVRGVFGRQSDLYLEYGAGAWSLPLTKVSGVLARVERLTPVPGGVEVRGTVDISGLPQAQLDGVELKLWPERSGRTFDARNLGRPEGLAAEHTAVGFSAVVDLEGMREGTFPLRVVVCTAGRDVSRPCTAAPQVDRDGPVTAGGRQARVHGDGKGAVLTTASAFATV
ncbi:glycosyltransferase family 2 protein [Actinomycetota bacterium Odt1-20B]